MYDYDINDVLNYIGKLWNDIPGQVQAIIRSELKEVIVHPLKIKNLLTELAKESDNFFPRKKFFSELERMKKEAEKERRRTNYITVKGYQPDIKARVELAVTYSVAQPPPREGFIKAFLGYVNQYYPQNLEWQITLPSDLPTPPNVMECVPIEQQKEPEPVQTPMQKFIKELDANDELPF